MSFQPRVLFVTPRTPFSRVVGPFLRSCGCQLTVARSFKSALRHIAPQDLLVTELKLREFNGLHLALRSLQSGIPAVVIADKSFEREVEGHGAVWVSPAQASTSAIADLVSGVLREHARPPDVPDQSRMLTPFSEATPPVFAHTYDPRPLVVDTTAFGDLSSVDGGIRNP
jgi:CheY-like chemotaxis protein